MMKRAFKIADKNSVTDIKNTYLLYFDRYKNNKNKLAKLATLLYNKSSELRELGDKRKATVYENLFLKCNEYYIVTFVNDLDDYYDLF